MALSLLAAQTSNNMTANEVLSDAGMTILIGLVVVFFVLLLLSCIFKLFGMVMTSLTGKTDETPVDAPAAAPVAAPATVPSVPVGPVASSAEVRNGLSEEETAVIAAAVAVSMPAGEKYTIKKIDRAD